MQQLARLPFWLSDLRTAVCDFPKLVAAGVVGRIDTARRLWHRIAADTTGGYLRGVPAVPRLV